MRRAFLAIVIFAAVPLIAAPPALAPRYRATATKLIAAAMANDAGYTKLEYLTTRIGHRMSGSQSLDTALQWMAEAMRREGFENVHLQPTTVPHWVRGRESAGIVAPQPRSIALLGLGGTVATLAGGITADVVVAHTLEEIDKLGREKVAGRILLINQPWAGASERDRYAGASPLRTRGASRAAAQGAKAMLIRSLTGNSLYTPHTGAMAYDPAIDRIPAAAITVEDAEWIERTITAGQSVQVRLELDGHHSEPDAPSANVMGEIRGRELPDEEVVVGGHIDSWDVGQGAHDDGAGVIAAWQAVALIKQLGLQPRRTIRAIGWTDEESSGRGGRAYRDALGPNIRNHVAAIEMDMGAEAPVGFDLAIGTLKPTDPAYQRARRALLEIASLLKPVGANQVFAANDEADIARLVADGVPGIGLHTVRRHYFDWHHTSADTFDKIDKNDFRKCIASLAVAAYVLADMPGRLGD